MIPQSLRWNSVVKECLGLRFYRDRSGRRCFIFRQLRMEIRLHKAPASMVSAKTRRILRYFARFIAGTSAEKQDARFKLRMKFRGVDLSFETVEELGLNPLTASPYGNSGGPALELVLGSLSVDPSDCILDLGCGKGGAAITLSGFPFARIDGIEISPRLAEICRRNLQRTGCVRGQIHLCDAGDFIDYDRYTFLYTFHSFNASVMTRVLENVRASLAKTPRKLTLIYKNPMNHDLVVQSGFRQTLEFTHCVPHYRIYEATGTAMDVPNHGPEKAESTQA